jgi:uncharacterized protein
MSDHPWYSPSLALPTGWEHARARRSSRYLTMRDGVRIAVEIHLPESPGGARLPAVVRQTRYLRALEPRAPILGPLVAGAFDLYARTRRVFLAAGYAWVDVDVRGSGASTGTRPYPWARDEIRDGAEVVDWIVAQPWSSGKVGSLGISYDGTCAEMLLVNQHPAVVAVAPTFALFDAYTDVAFPGGIHLAWFTEVWARYNAALDRGAFPEALASVLRLIVRAAGASPSPHGVDRLLAPLAHLDRGPFERAAAALLSRLIAGVVPVDGDRRALARAVAEHGANFSVHEGAKKIAFRDDRGLSPVAPDDTIDALSPHAYAARTGGSGAAVYSYSGHRDGAYPNGAIRRFATLATPGSRLTIGPWLHTGRLRIRPFDVAVPTDFDHDAELLGFFDEHLRGRPPSGDGKPVHYYTFVEERWKAADRWPPPFEPTALYLGARGDLSATAPEGEQGDDALRVDPAAGTGERSRWRSLFSLVPGDYPDRRERDRLLLVFDSEPLPEAIEVTGHPVAALHVSWDEDDDGRIFAYLEDVAPDGRVAYVTEGQLRAVHRRTLGPPRELGGVPQHGFRREDALPLGAGAIGELAFELLPISWRFERGHRVRLAIAGGDGDHFAASRRSTLRVHRTRSHASRIELPVVRGALRRPGF